MHPAIIDVESTIVPSQSNTIKSKRRTESFQKFRALNRQRRFERHRATRDRMLEGRCTGVQKHPCQTRGINPACDAFVQLEVAVLVVADNRKSEVRQVHANLVRAAGFQVGFEQ